jgi:hypothetical protein
MQEYTYNSYKQLKKAKQNENKLSKLCRSKEVQTKYKQEYVQQEFEAFLQLHFAEFQHYITNNKYPYNLDPSIQHMCIFSETQHSEEQIREILKTRIKATDYILHYNEPSNQSCRIPHWHIFYEIAPVGVLEQLLEDVIGYEPIIKILDIDTLEQDAKNLTPEERKRIRTLTSNESRNRSTKQFFKTFN